MEVYTTQHADTPKNQRLTVQCQIARTLLEEEGEDVKTRIREEATAEHRALLEQHNNEAEGLPSVDEEERER